MHTVHKTDSVLRQGLMNKLDSGRQVNQEVVVVHVLYRNAELADSRRGVVGRDGFASDRHYMCNPAL